MEKVKLNNTKEKKKKSNKNSCKTLTTIYNKNFFIKKSCKIC